MSGEYDIMGTDAHLFCKMQRKGDDIVLKTNHSSITFTNLTKQVVSPKPERGKRRAERPKE